jgi:hypothetical protein
MQTNKSRHLTTSGSSCRLNIAGSSINFERYSEVRRRLQLARGVYAMLGIRGRRGDHRNHAAKKCRLRQQQADPALPYGSSLVWRCQPQSQQAVGLRARQKSQLIFYKNLVYICKIYRVDSFQEKISGFGTDFGLLAHLLSGLNKQRALEQSIFLS